MTNNARSYQEKRDYIRMQMNADAVATYEGKDFSATCIDLSSSGVQIQCSQPFEINSTIDINISSGSESTTPLTIKATILRVNRLADDSFRYGACIEAYL